MKVLFDHQLFSYQRYGGASKYFAMLLNAMPREMWDTTTLFSNNEYVRNLNLFKTLHFLPNLYFKGQGRIMHELNKPYSKYRLRKHNYDVFHETHFETYCLKEIGDKPMVMTYHDVNYITINPNPELVELQKKSITRANAVIAISENTKKDILKYFDIDERKIHVVYHGIPQIFEPTETLSNSEKFDFPYILYVGTRGKHKNFQPFIKAFAEIHKFHPEVRMVCTAWPFSKEENELFKTLNILDSMVQLNADELSMNYLYQHALLFVFPSLYEGFGMPLLEAMLNRCPIASSNSSCLAEVGGEAVEYFDPNDTDSMISCVSKLIENEELRRSLIKRGCERVRAFTWEQCADKHIKVYRSLI